MVEFWFQKSKNPKKKYREKNETQFNFSFACCFFFVIYSFYTSVMRSHQLMTACSERNHQF